MREGLKYLEDNGIGLLLVTGVPDCQWRTGPSGAGPEESLCHVIHSLSSWDQLPRFCTPATCTVSQPREACRNWVEGHLMGTNGYAILRALLVGQPVGSPGLSRILILHGAARAG